MPTLKQPPTTGRPISALSDAVYLFLRRMRAPLILVLSVFTICSFGLSLMPGVDPQGQPAPPMTMFEAFYVITYTATTIGFGEVPQPYSTPQRAWMVLAIYLSVVVWSYTIVSVMSLVQDKGFQAALRRGRFVNRVRHLHEPFYIVCGVGETGWLVCHGLDRLGLRFVVIEKNEDRMQQVQLAEFHYDSPMVAADASRPNILRQAGIENPYCRGVMALVDDDAVNQAIAVTVRLLAPRVPVLARVRDVDTETHIGVFGGDLVINPFEHFAERFGSALTRPQRYRLREILTGLEDGPLPELLHPPKGHWIVCGYGRFGHAVVEELRDIGNTVSVIDQKNYEGGGVDVFGTGTDEDSLDGAGIKRAVGLVAGNLSDTKNLAIAVAARDLNPEIFIVTRQNQHTSTPLFDCFEGDLPMVPSSIVAREFLARITTPLLVRFLNRLPTYSEKACSDLCTRLSTVNENRIPVIWSNHLCAKDCEGAVAFFDDGQTLTLQQLLVGERQGDPPLDVTVLLVARGRRVIELPSLDFQLKLDDQVLFAGSDRSLSTVLTRLQNVNILDFITSGTTGGGGYLWRWLQARRLARADDAA